MLKRLLIAAGLWLAASAPGWSQSGQLGANQIWGNPTAGGKPGQPSNVGSFLTPGTGVTISGTPKAIIGLANQITAAGPVGSATQTPVLTYNAQGQLTVVSLATIAPPFSAVTGSAVCSQLPALTGNVTTAAGSCATSIAAGAVTFADLASAALATAAQYIAGAANTIVPASVIYTAETTTTFGATTTFDFSTFINTAVTLTGNITTMSVANVTAGKAGTITFIQDATGSRTTVWNSNFKFAGGVTPTLSTAANAVDVLSYSCRSATFCVASLIKAVQ